MVGGQRLDIDAVLQNRGCKSVQHHVHPDTMSRAAAGAEVIVVKMIMNGDLFACAALPYAEPGGELFAERVSVGLPWVLGAELDEVTLEPVACIRGEIDEPRFYTGVVTEEQSRLRMRGAFVFDSIIWNPLLFAVHGRGYSDNEHLGNLTSGSVEEASAGRFRNSSGPQDPWAENRVPLQLLGHLQADNAPSKLGEPEQQLLQAALLGSCTGPDSCQHAGGSGDDDLVHTPFQRSLRGTTQYLRSSILNESALPQPRSVMVEDGLTVAITETWLPADGSRASDAYLTTRHVILGHQLDTNVGGTGNG